jgi:excinuclease ABC subunit A
MQFLSDVYLRCPDCDGKRYRGETLEITIEGKSIADVLAMTVAEAARFFRKHEDVQAKLAPLIDVGLEYLRLGQPVPTLSGGEAQRLKLAGHLVDADSSDGKLFLFDEPTTGLHFDDVAKLLRAFRQLLDAGHSLIVIEHNLDVIRSSDWIVDLGPEAARRAGAWSSPARSAMRRMRGLAYGESVEAYEAALGVPPRFLVHHASVARAGCAPPPGDAIRIHNARTQSEERRRHDSARRFTVVTGVERQGHARFRPPVRRGQRRYLNR